MVSNKIPDLSEVRDQRSGINVSNAKGSLASIINRTLPGT